MIKNKETLETSLLAVIITKSFILQSLENFMKFKNDFTKEEQEQASNALVTTLQVLTEFEDFIRANKKKEDAQ